MRKIKMSHSITDKTDGNSVDMYFKELYSIDYDIGIDEEKELAKKIKEGDQKALNKLVEANLRFVVSVAKKYQNQGMKLPDLISEGNLGLIEAAKRFDESKGYKFISYAVWWIRRYILIALAVQSRIVRLPLNKVGDLTKLNKVRELTEQEFGRELLPEDIAESMGIDLEEAGRLQGMSRKYLSLDAPFLEDGYSDNLEGNLLGVLEDESLDSPDKPLMQESISYEINKALSELTQKEIDVISLYFGLNGKMSIREMAEKFDVTPEAIRKTKEKGMKKLRKNKEVLKYLL